MIKLEAKLFSFSALKLDGGDWSDSRFGRITSGKKPFGAQAPGCLWTLWVRDYSVFLV